MKLLLVEDSRTVAAVIKKLIEEQSDFRVTVADSGEKAAELFRDLRPDIAVVDFVMPGMNGIETVRALIEQRFVPIVGFSSAVGKSSVKAFQMLEAGAVEFVEKPGRTTLTERSWQRQFIELLRTCLSATPGRSTNGQRQRDRTDQSTDTFDLVAIGSSTGGPTALKRILTPPRADVSLRAPVLVAQHIATGFGAGFSEWLESETGQRIRLVLDDVPVAPGTIYVAPDTGEHDLIIEGRLIRCVPSRAIQPAVSPSVDRLFSSVAEHLGYEQKLGLLLTGMGTDGAAGLAELRANGAVTVCQDQASSVVWGMAGAAVERGAAERVLNLEDIHHYFWRTNGDTN